MNDDKQIHGTNAPAQTAFVTNSVGSVSSSSASKNEASAKKKKPGKNDWMKYQYPNRSIRRQYRNKDAKRITAADIEDGTTPFVKWYEETVANIIQGQRRHAAFGEAVAHTAMIDEQITDSLCLRSFIAKYGDMRGNREFNAYKKLQNAMIEKKMEIHG